jgi:hypothetical protein
MTQFTSVRARHPALRHMRCVFVIAERIVKALQPVSAIFESGSARGCILGSFTMLAHGPRTVPRGIVPTARTASLAQRREQCTSVGIYRRVVWLKRCPSRDAARRPCFAAHRSKTAAYVTLIFLTTGMSDANESPNEKLATWFVEACCPVPQALGCIEPSW